MTVELNFPTPVTNRESLFDRQKELDKILQTLASPIPRSIVIIGERRSGKSSLVNVAIQQLKDSYEVVQIPHTLTRNDFAAELMSEICRIAGTNLRQTSQLDAQGRFSLITVGSYLSELNNLTLKAGMLNVLVCIDRFDSMLQKCSDNDSTQILDLILFLVEKPNLPFRFVFTMSKITRHLQDSYTSPFLLSSVLIQLSHWDFREAMAFVNWLIQGRLILDNEAHKLLFAAAGGHPFFTKAMVHTLLSRQENVARPEIGGPEIQQTIIACISSYETQMALKSIAATDLSSEQLWLLSFIYGQKTRVSAKQLRSLGGTVLQQALELVSRGFLRTDGYQGSFWPRLGLFGYWMEHHAVEPTSATMSTAADTTYEAEAGPRLAVSHQGLRSTVRIGVVINEITRYVEVDGREVTLSNDEYRVLLVLARNIGTTLTLSDFSAYTSASKTHIKQTLTALREKLGSYLIAVTSDDYRLSEVRIEGTPAAVIPNLGLKRES